LVSNICRSTGIFPVSKKPGRDEKELMLSAYPTMKTLYALPLLLFGCYDDFDQDLYDSTRSFQICPFCWLYVNAPPERTSWMRIRFLLGLLSASLIPICPPALCSEFNILSNYDQYSLQATDAIETDKDGSGFSLSLGSQFTFAAGQIFYGIGFRSAQAKGEDYDRQQELEVSDLLFRLGFLYAIPGLENHLKAGVMTDVTRGKGSSLGYEGGDAMQTVARLAPVFQLHLPLDRSWQPFLEVSHSWDLNNTSYRENRSSVGLGIQLAFGETASAPANAMEKDRAEPNLEEFKEKIDAPAQQERP
jgi:hypothetical protein